MLTTLLGFLNLKCACGVIIIDIVTVDISGFILLWWIVCS